MFNSIAIFGSDRQIPFGYCSYSRSKISQDNCLRATSPDLRVPEYAGAIAD